MRTLFRVGAILFHEGKLVTTKMKKKDKEYYVLPGGGVESEENLQEALKRELKEELNIEAIGFKLAYIRELNIKEHGRGAEFYFYVYNYKGEPSKGYDPETKESILDELAFLTFDDLKALTFYPIELINILKEDAHQNFPIVKHLGLYDYP